MKRELIIAPPLAWLTIYLVGCHPPASSLPTPLVTHGVNETDRITLHHAGKILAGTTIQHTFPFRNSTGSNIELMQPDGVQASCGCTRATVADERLTAGQTTSIEVCVRTEGREGNVSEVVETTWKDAMENRIVLAFAIRAIVVNGLVLNPAALTFGKEEVARGVTKHVTCTSDHPVDWSTATVVAEADYLEIGGHELLPNGKGCQFHVICHAAGSGVSRQDNVLVHADRAGKAQPSNVPFSVRLPVYSIDPAPLRVAPSVAILRRSPDAASWMGTLFLTGDAISAGASVRQIQSDGPRITFRASRIADGAIRVDLNCWPARDARAPPTQQLDLILTDGQRQRATVRLDNEPQLGL